MNKLLAVMVTLVFTSAAYIGYSAYRDLHYLNMDIDWSWYHFSPAGFGAQIARTHDTNQLLLRRVDISQKVAVFAHTTIDNKFEVVVIREQECQPNASQPAHLTEKNGPTHSIASVCSGDGKTQLYRQVWKKPPTFTLTVDNFELHTDIASWDTAMLIKDQFMQLNPHYFDKQNNGVRHEWARD
ncbi:hypothetical protein [Vibrio aestuarianus]|uniref:Threonine transporter RhtB n=1 Tax=Vibrio aestuarianus TaxID=28171 RepID=A0ABM9FKP5_9VIBR|nr:hypothetical protein [Vibrio aestuarianus]MDE1229637.1 hypothetical protein [Vibrio aestuarianus]MDE1255167.1 hypothetical protein [Vibrio aestuarianus]MDE1272404.1 hypothetical protein [Vibrio aestuarianus]MDE1293763.1 hypothetical protein [Vibrio aestuarianus]MDE1307901.1 hypothetical protein [Vibrio aestuarianus]